MVFVAHFFVLFQGSKKGCGVGGKYAGSFVKMPKQGLCRLRLSCKLFLFPALSCLLGEREGFVFHVKMSLLPIRFRRYEQRIKKDRFSF